MIKIKGRVVTFSGKDYLALRKISKRLGLSMQNVFTGMAWEYIMAKAQKGDFLAKAKVS